MSKLGCPCGHLIWNGCDAYETSFHFISSDVIKEHWEDYPFFEFECSEFSTEIWICEVCDRMMFFDGDSISVTRYMRRCDAEGIPQEELNKPYSEGVCYSNLLPNEVYEYFTERAPKPYSAEGEDEKHEIDIGEIPPKTAFEEIFSGKHGWFHHWWYARLYQDYLVFYSPCVFQVKDDKPAVMWDKPVKAWMRYEQVWEK